MPSIYLVSTGSYSDYHIERAFSTKEKAEEWLSDVRDGDNFSSGWDDYRIEEYDIDSFADKPYLGYSVTMDYESGNTLETRRTLIHLNATFGFHKSNYSHNLPFIYLEAKVQDEAAAVKIANEIRCQLKARGVAEFGCYDRNTLQLVSKTK
jgi:hypothetical protein